MPSRCGSRSASSCGPSATSTKPRPRNRRPCRSPWGPDVGPALLAILLVYTVNQLHFPQELGIKGLNVANLLFALTALAVLLGARTEERGPRPVLKRAL